MAHKVLIESLRKKKALSMQEICGDYISHSSYSRFIKQGQSLSIDKLLFILRQMDLSFREAGLFDHNIQLSNADKVLMIEVMNENDRVRLVETAQLFTSKAKRTYDIYGMMAIQMRLKIGGEIGEKQAQELQDYLFNVNNWDFKEMYLFTFIMDRMDSGQILYHTQRTFQRAADPYFLELNLNLIILLDRAHFEFLKRKEINNAQKLFDQLSSLVVNRTFHSVQGEFVIAQTLHQVLKDNTPEDYQKISRLYHSFTAVEGNYYAQRLKGRYLELQPLYDLPELDWLEATEGF